MQVGFGDALTGRDVPALGRPLSVPLGKVKQRPHAVVGPA